MFKKLKVVTTKGTLGIVKQMFILITLVETKYVEGKVGIVSQVSKLLDI